jgi:hypothetical protein
MKRKVKVKITTASSLTIRLRGDGLKARCLACEREVEMVSEAEAQEILQVDALALDRLVAANHVHTIQAVSGNLRVCKDSLFNGRFTTKRRNRMKRLSLTYVLHMLEKNFNGLSRRKYLGIGALLFSLIALSGPLVVVDSQGGSLTSEDNTDRRGSDYKDFDLSQANWELCRDACANDGNCQAYTFVRPGVQGSSARCWLKSSVPAGSRDSCCISGVKNGSTGSGILIGQWEVHAAGYTLTMNITNQDGNTFSGSFVGEESGGKVLNGQLRGNTIEFDRERGWKQHWSAQLVNEGGRLRMVNGFWSGDGGKGDWDGVKK